jgi:hypothetical protein
MKHISLTAAAFALALANSAPASAADICRGYGPQTPRDIASIAGTNPRQFNAAPAAAKLNLCNIHMHAQAEHKGPGFSLFAGADEHGGYKCNATSSLTKAELADPAKDHGACHGIKPGDTIEVHWVHTSCDVTPGAGLGACLTAACANPQLRVETQVFLLVNDTTALNFADFAYGGNMAGGLHQAKALPTGTGAPVVFAGSTTGPSYSQAKCSPLQVTWSVRPQCAKMNIATVHDWCKGNVFKEDHAHGVRQLVTAPELLSPIK